MVSIDYIDGKGWHNARVMPYGPIELDPSAIVLHYAQEVFEGLKAYRWADGSIVSFRAEANAARLRSSARRLAIPELPEEVFIESLRQLIAVDGRMGAARGRRGVALPAALHLRLRARARCAARIRIPLHGDRLAAGAYFPRGIKPVSVWLSHEYADPNPPPEVNVRTIGNLLWLLLAGSGWRSATSSPASCCASRSSASRSASVVQAGRLRALAVRAGGRPPARRQRRRRAWSPT